MNKKVYIYPITARLKTGVQNPYINDFINSSTHFFDYLNIKNPSNIGILNLIKYTHKTDYLILNWVENLPEKKFGFFQTLYFLLFLNMKKIWGIKIIWVMHNKISHNKEKLKLKRTIFNSLLKKSDLIITHSKEGVKYAQKQRNNHSNHLFYFPHPVNQEYIPEKRNQKKEYDILIWGSLLPYKGIDKFLEFMVRKNELNNYKIIIVGKDTSNKYFSVLEKYKSSKCLIENRFIDKQELIDLTEKSMITLFTYNNDSVLSSGALIDSISFRANVIGPHTGAFADAAEEGVIQTFQNFEDLLRILKEFQLNRFNKPSEQIELFIRKYSWDNFSNELNMKLKQIF
ncbi:MAG: glycosyltransferase [bacterium]